MNETETVRPGRIPQLDGVRGVAILLVLIWHFLVAPAGEPSTRALLHFLHGLRLSWSGVDLFFVLSGFLIGGILIDNRDSRNYFQVFYFRRICRIFPLYFLWLLLFVIARFLFGAATGSEPLSSEFSPLLPWWSYLTFSQNIASAHSGFFGAQWLGVTWSLAVEEQFYLLLPFMLRFVPSRSLIYVLVAMILAAPVARSFVFGAFPQNALPAYVLLPCRMDSLLLGVLGAILVREPRVRRSLTDNSNSLRLVLLVLLLGFLLFTLKGEDIGSAGMTYLGYSWLALMYLAFILLAVTESSGLISWITSVRPLRELGTVAYGVYLMHQAMNHLFHALILNQTPTLRTLTDILVALLALIFTLSLARISWVVYEKRFLRLGHAMKYDSGASGMTGPQFGVVMPRVPETSSASGTTSQV
jgi:peptidoglycan/LPS O-acetylase OafA/YrhL